MGWKDNHLHEFERDGKRWGIVQLYEDEELDVADDGDVTLAEVLKSEGDSMIYVYDFGGPLAARSPPGENHPTQRRSESSIVLGRRTTLPTGRRGRGFRLQGIPGSHLRSDARRVRASCGLGWRSLRR